MTAGSSIGEVAVVRDGGKRLFDILVAAAGLPLAALVCLPFATLIWLGDRRPPFYSGWRIGRDWKPYRQHKMRSMVWGAELSGVEATSAEDARITPVGRFMRRWKIDELPQLINVLTGHMSLVGPRPNCMRECSMYTPEEQRILAVRPGVTDIASIVFIDEESILATTADSDLGYHQLVRPWKSRFCLLYIDNRSLRLDVELIAITALAMVSHRLALSALQPVLRRLGADERMRRVACRRDDLVPHPPPGATEPVRSVPA